MYCKPKYSRQNHPISVFLVNMSYITNNDNIYKIGATVTAKANPDVKLTIIKYFHRTYYCADVNDPTQKLNAYFEKQLIPPPLSKLG